MRQIYLSNSDLVVLIDDSDFELVTQYRWQWQKPGHAVTCSHGTTILMHCLIMGPSPKDGLIVDHRDDNGLNNQRSNLRFATYGQNCQRGNFKIKNKTSNFRGVRYDALRDRYRASIYFNNKEKFLGRFNTEKAAAIAYNVAARELFGDEAYFNEF